MPERDETAQRLKALLVLERRENELLRQNVQQYRQNALSLAASVVLILSAVLQVPLPTSYKALPPGVISDALLITLHHEGYQSIYFFRSTWQLLVTLTGALSVLAFYLSIRIYFTTPSYIRLDDRGLVTTGANSFDYQAILEASLELFRTENQELYKQWANTKPLVVRARQVVLAYVIAVLILASLWGILGI